MDKFIAITNLKYAYGDFLALKGIDLQISAGQFAALLGPNGSGKTTLFRILAGLTTPADGEARVFDHDLATNAQAVRQKLGVVFQAPSLDRKLTVLENLRFHGQLYGLKGHELQDRIADLTSRLQIQDRLSAKVETLSGGLARRVELARCLLHRPQGVLLDEPSTGLDPTSRLEFWDLLEDLHRAESLSILFTTHWFEEAERASQVGILDAGELVAWDDPAKLCGDQGHDIVTIRSKNNKVLAEKIAAKFQVEPKLRAGTVRFALTNGHVPIGELVEFVDREADSLQVSKPTLEDVYIARTGRSFQEAESA